MFSLSNWTELDVWQYIMAEQILVVPLYFAKERPVVRRSGALIMADDERLRLEAGETPEMRRVRFRGMLSINRRRRFGCRDGRPSSPKCWRRGFRNGRAV